jgi:hypothetical protein
MGEALEAWLENHARREDAQSHQGLQTAKLVTTFSAAIAATFVATSLAEGPAPTCWDKGAEFAMAFSVLGVLVIVFHTRRVPDAERIADGLKAKGSSDDEIVKALRAEVKGAAKLNKDWADHVQWIMFAQVVASMAASILAIVSLHLSYSS